MKNDTKLRRCAVYTRKSSEEGLEQDFNSLHAQREACEAYIGSQKSEGWRLIATAYDDGGISGGTMERPALRRLLVDIAAGTVDTIVVYKVDRLTRSLADFAKMVEVFDRHAVSFVAVTQQFNTTTSMGRLTLNVLLSFAQFEREVTGERIRDKIAASKQKGIWMGGYTPMGYDVRNRKLIVNQVEAETVRSIFEHYRDLGCVQKLREALDDKKVRAKPRGGGEGQPFSRSALYRLLQNPIYKGEIRHKDAAYPGQHEAIVSRDLWDAVQAQLKRNGAADRARSGKASPSLLVGKLYDADGRRLTPIHVVKAGRRYRYYVSQALMTGGTESTAKWRLSAGELERVIASEARRMLRDRVLLAESFEHDLPISGLGELLDYAADHATIAEDSKVLELVQRIGLGETGIDITLCFDQLIRDPGDAASPSVNRHVPMRIKRRGVETKLVVSRDPLVKADPGLLKAVARSRRWFASLISDEGSTMVEIARRENVGDTYVSRILPLAFLSPGITQAIVEGRQPVDLTTQMLTGGDRIPLDWAAQAMTFGFS